MDQKLNDKQETVLIGLYNKNEANLAVDKLPYTPTFDALVNTFNLIYPKLNATHNDLYNILINLRKAGKLLHRPKKSKKYGTQQDQAAIQLAKDS